MGTSPPSFQDEEPYAVRMEEVLAEAQETGAPLLSTTANLGEV